MSPTFVCICSIFFFLKRFFGFTKIARSQQYLFEKFDPDNTVPTYQMIVLLLGLQSLDRLAASLQASLSKHSTSINHDNFQYPRPSWSVKCIPFLVLLFQSYHSHISSNNQLQQAMKYVNFDKKINKMKSYFLFYIYGLGVSNGGTDRFLPDIKIENRFNVYMYKSSSSSSWYSISRSIVRITPSFSDNFLYLFSSWSMKCIPFLVFRFQSYHPHILQ